MMVALDSREVRVSGPCTAEHEQVIGEDGKPYPALHPAFPAISTAPQTMTAFEGADPSFTARAPAKRRANQPRPCLPRLAWQHHVADATFAGSAFISSRRKVCVSHCQGGRTLEERDVPIESWLPQGAIRLTALHHRVVSNELPLGFLNLHDPAEFSGP